MEAGAHSAKIVGDAPGIVVRGVRKRFGRGASATTALSDVNLTIGRGEFVSLIGPSGCGKSTLLRMLANLEVPDLGTLSLLGETPQRASERKLVGLVPQTPALLPWRSVLVNVCLPFEVNKRARRENASEADILDPAEVLRQLGLGDVLDRKPFQLSGGMQQRVAIARAFCFGAPVLLMDEPFSALDEFTRESVRTQLLELWEAHRKTVVFVTHSVPEAVILSDRIVVMSARPGRVQTVVDVPLPRPRDARLEDSPAFTAIAAEVRASLRAGWEQ